MPDVPSKTWTTARLPGYNISSVSSPPANGSYGIYTSCFKDLARSLAAIGQGQGHDLVESREFDLCFLVSAHAPSCLLLISPTHIVQNDQRTVDAANGVVPDARRHGHHARVDISVFGHGCGRRAVGGPVVELAGGGERSGGVRREVLTASV